MSSKPLDMVADIQDTSKSRVSRKRNRTPASCNHCRIRKHKCNREQPCEGCVKSGDASTCSYVARSSQEGQISFDAGQRDALMARIDRLEQMLQTVMQNTPPSPGSFPSLEQSMPAISHQSKAANYDDNTEDATEKFGVLKIEPDQNRTLYMGSSHWVSIMCEIDDFRSYLEEVETKIEERPLQYQTSISSQTGNLLLGIVPVVTREALLAQVPPREIVDEIIAKFMEMHKEGYHIVHEPTFYKEYEQHWREPQKTSTNWVGLLFAMLYSVETQIKANRFSVPNPRIQPWLMGRFRGRLIESLISSNYLNPNISSIQSLILYIQGEWINSQDPDSEATIVTGLLVRLAMNMGLHRDPSSHPKISVFQGEIRRRLWAQIRQMDTFQSVWLSRPPLIDGQYCDTKLPKNLYDYELVEEMESLPLSRPLTDGTEISFIIAKTRLVLVTGNMTRIIQSSRPLDEATILACEQQIEEARRSTPPQFRLDTWTNTLEQPANFHLRIGLERLYHVCKCILYRKFIPLARQNAIFMSYRDSCVESALQLLDYQAVLLLDTATIYPQNIRTRNLLALSTFDFFIAGMCLVLDLHYNPALVPMGSQLPASDQQEQRDLQSTIINRIETSLEFWRLIKDESVEAAKALALFSFALIKAKQAQTTCLSPSHDNQPPAYSQDWQHVFAVNIPGAEEYRPLAELDWSLWTS